MSKRKHIAVTGTKGKSTTLRILQHGLLFLKKRVWGSYADDGRFFQGKFLQNPPIEEDYFEAAPCDYMLTEATSFLLARDTYAEEPTDAVIFTGFDPSEHCELHPEEKDYWHAKLRAFEGLKPEGKAIVCRDMKKWNDLPRDIKKRIVSYGEHAKSQFRVINVETSIEGTGFNLVYEGTVYPVNTPLIGKHNAVNLAGAIACLVSQFEVPIEAAILTTSAFQGLKGRNNVMHDTNNNVTIVIDYAHTADSLTQTLTTWREIAGDRSLVCVFGCGGDKSKLKRPLMARAAERLADKVFVTNDNPRREDPRGIIDDILAGMKRPKSKKVSVIMDRALAIKLAIEEAKDAVVVIAGKGHEGSIEAGDFHIPHNDWEAAMGWLINNAVSYMTPQHTYWD